MTENLEVQSPDISNARAGSSGFNLLSLTAMSDNKTSSAKANSEHTTEQLDPSESSSSFDGRVADSLSARMAERTFSQLSDFESGNGLNFSDVQRMHRLVATKDGPGHNDFMKTSSDLICTEKLTVGAPESGALHLTEDQFRRLVKDQIEQLEPTADGPAVSDLIPVSLIVDGRRKEVGATLQITEDATGDLILKS